MADSNKKSVLIVGGGAVGAIAAVNLEAGGLATVTLVLRSNYDVVKEHGYTISSCDHGNLKGWRPSVGMFGNLTLLHLDDFWGRPNIQTECGLYVCVMWHLGGGNSKLTYKPLFFEKKSATVSLISLGRVSSSHSIM